MAACFSTPLGNLCLTLRRQASVGKHNFASRLILKVSGEARRVSACKQSGDVQLDRRLLHWLDPHGNFLRAWPVVPTVGVEQAVPGEGKKNSDACTMRPLCGPKARKASTMLLFSTQKGFGKQTNVFFNM